MTLSKIRIPLLLFILSLVTTSAAERFVDTGDVVVFDGNKINHKPGDIFKIKAGKRTHLTIQNFTGTAEKPITFINSGGVVHINSIDKNGSALNIHTCKHIRFTGSGEREIRYGFKLACGKKGPHALNIRKRSTSIEVDHIEVYAAGFAGFNVKDEPSIKDKTTRSQFTMRNISLHDNFVHNVTGEGFYIGHTFFDGFDPKKTGTPLMPHVIEGLKIYNNHTHNTGCEGIQIGSTTKDCQVYNNTITESGKTPFAQYQSNSLQIGTGTQAHVYNNYIDTCPSNNLILFGHGNIIIENNIFKNAGKQCMYVKASAADSYIIRNNTIINPTEKAIVIGNSKAPKTPIEITNNLIALKNKKLHAIEIHNKKAPIKESNNTIIPADKMTSSPTNGAVFPSKKSILKMTRAFPASHKPTPWKQPDH
ncbi:MAG: right-handed parallel beta-helix repeat-containing protein [Akkermansiaceae bacterium]